MRFFRPGRRNDEPPPVDPESPNPAPSPWAAAGEDDAVDEREPGERTDAETRDARPAETERAPTAEEAAGLPPAVLDDVAADVAEGDPDVSAKDEPSVADAGADRLADAAADPAEASPARSVDDAEAAADAAVAGPPTAAPSRPSASDALMPLDRSTGAGQLPRRRSPVVLSSGPTGSDPADDDTDGRAADLRFASLHLRGGQHALARAELEALAGRGILDEQGLLDLAEIRWRTGDLGGAGDAANALLARGSESALALVIAAEAIAAAGRPGEARRLSSRALEVADSPLDPLFAGMPRSTIWPASPEPDVAPSTTRRGRNRLDDTGGAPSTASEAFAGGRAALARGDATRAALLLGVALRLAPEFADNVLRAVTGRDDQPLLALVRGDALRLLGREAEALEAFDRARGRASAPGGMSQPAAAPGLFDADPALADDEGA